MKMIKEILGMLFALFILLPLIIILAIFMFIKGDELAI